MRDEVKRNLKTSYISINLSFGEGFRREKEAINKKLL